MNLRPLRIGVVGLLGAAAACTVMDGLVIPDRSVTVVEAGAPDASDGGDGCEHALLPAPPASDADSTSDLEIVAAMRMINLQPDPEAGVPGGYDLDNTCGPSCAPLYPAVPAMDDQNGRDTSSTALLATIESILKGNFSPIGRFNELIAKGATGVVLRLTQYNGLPDDPSVRLAVYQSGGIPTPDAGPETHNEPLFDASDRWSIRRDQIIPGAPDPYFPQLSAAGYVTGGLLVVRVPPFTLSFTGELTDAAFVVRVARVDGALQLVNGLIVGKWPVKNALRTVLTPRNLNDAALCEIDGGRELAAGVICQAADLLSALSAGPACDAISMAIQFVAAPASLGDIVEPLPPLADPCDPATLVCPK